MPSTPTESHKSVFTVTELNRRIKQILERAFPLVWIMGEISNLRIPSSGHVYFTLKDSEAQLSAVIFKGQARHLSFKPEDGRVILGMGRVSVFEPRGVYQIIIEYMEPKGRGDLQLAFEQLKQKLADEGLFDEKHKKPLPPLPRIIHVITSPTGAVIFDTINTIQRRFLNIPIVLIPTSVQGPNAPREIASAIALLNSQPDAQVAILARGGGSLEDLQAFNDERVARAIYKSEVPIISAIGHETDYTIADFTADLRAPTPSAAAELVVPVKMAFIEHVDALTRKLVLITRAAIDQQRQRLKNCRERLLDPRRKLYDGRLYLDDLTHRMEVSLQRTLRDRGRELSLSASRLAQNPLRGKIKIMKQKLEQITINNLYSIDNIIRSKKWVRQDMASRLSALNPLAVLSRGYSITRLLPQRTIIKNSRWVNVNQPVEITLASGSLLCRIEGKEDDGEKNL
ncbi:MAG: exodeoxyribonuclease VII large subunit [Desulfosarcina sp.]|nr:exodeoxyribonuclease VII large subunit [Desulfobacterales bacterium]